MVSYLAGWGAVLLANAGAAAPNPPEALSLGGWLVMLISVGAVLSVTAFAVVRVLTLPPVEMEDIKGPLEIDTGDTSNAD